MFSSHSHRWRRCPGKFTNKRFLSRHSLHLVALWCLLSPDRAAAQEPICTELQKLLSFPVSDSWGNIRFGEAVSVSGDVMAVGAGRGNDLGPESGSVYVFRWDGTSWVPEQKLHASDGAAFDFFGGRADAFADAVRVSGDVIVVGAYGDDDLGTESGAAYVFRWDGVSWVEEQKLLASDGSTGDWFGGSVSIDGDVIVVGSPGNDNPDFNIGAAYVFHWNGASWVEEQKIKGADVGSGQDFGVSVAISGNAIVAGVWGDDDLGPSSGSAFVFRWNGTSWTQEQKLLASDGAASDTFGRGVAISGDVLVISAVLDDDLGPSSGSAYVFRWNGTSWVQEQKLLAFDGGFQHGFGTSVAVSADAIVVGAKDAWFPGAPNSNEGAAYVFHYDGTAWLQHQIIASDYLSNQTRNLGASIAMSGDVIAVGAWESVYVYSCEQVLNQPPVAVCATETITVEAEGSYGALVTGLNGLGSFDPDDDELAFHWDVSDVGVILDDADSATPVGIFPIGITTATLTVSDGKGGVDTCDVVILVEDTTPPEVMCTSDLAMLWPPNHDMRMVRLIVTAFDTATNPEEITVVSLTVRSDEPDDAEGEGDGATTGDVDGSDGFTSPANVTAGLAFDESIGPSGAWVVTVMLRAERAGDGDGRCYTIDVVAIDSSDNEAFSSCCIVVPHDQRNW